jgi:hypothetical protein
MSDRRSMVFIGSSSEGAEIAEAIQVNLDRECDVVVWSQGVFGLGEGTLESLVRRVTDFDFAVLILTPDDLITSREKTQPSARDNVLIELGLFVGAIGRERTFVVYDRLADIKMPSDLAGVTIADYQLHASGNLRSSVGAPSTLIKEKIREFGVRTRGNRESGIQQRRQGDLRRITEEIRIEPADDTIISAERISELPVAPSVVDIIEREAAKIVKSRLVELLVEVASNGGKLIMSIPILKHQWTLLEFGYDRRDKQRFGLGYPISVTEYLSGDDKTVHSIENRQQLEELLQETFRSSGAVSKIEYILQVAKSRIAEREAGGLNDTAE